MGCDCVDLTDAFRRTFNLLLGDGEAELGEFEGYLQQYLRPPAMKKSTLTGKTVVFSGDGYCRNSRSVSYDETSERRFKPLNLNEIKDIDNILDAIDDRIYYTGNKVLGNSELVANSDLCIDCFHVANSTNIRNSKYVAYSTMIRESEFVFGSSTSGKARHMIRTVSYNSARCFDAYYVADTSDTYFSHNCVGCTHNMFSLNQRGSRYVIGNLQLEKDRYFKLKTKLLGEVREKLLRDKMFPSIFNLRWRPHGLPEIAVKESPAEQNTRKIDKAFGVTTRIVLGKDLGPVVLFETWLGEHTATVEMKKTGFGRETPVPFSSFPFFLDVDRDRFATNEEALELGKLKIELGEDAITVEKIRNRIESIAYYSPEIKVGKNQNIIGCPLSENSINLYKVVDANIVKDSGVSGQVFNSENIFGSFWVIDSRFCLNCYHSANLSGCFEMDGCSNCRDSMFCHNSENLDNCMFCFNTKSKRYAVGNVELGREEYLRIRGLVLGQIVEHLEREGRFDYDIYNIGCKREATKKL